MITVRKEVVITNFPELKTNCWHLSFLFISCSWSTRDPIIHLLFFRHDNIGLLTPINHRVWWENEYFLGSKLFRIWKQNMVIFLSFYQLHLYFGVNKFTRKISSENTADTSSHINIECAEEMNIPLLRKCFFLSIPSLFLSQ